MEVKEQFTHMIFIIYTSLDGLDSLLEEVRKSNVLKLFYLDQYTIFQLITVIIILKLLAILGDKNSTVQAALFTNIRASLVP